MLDEPYTMSDPTPAEPPVYAALMRIRPPELTNSGWAKAANMPRNIFNGIREHGNPKRQTLEKLLDAIGWTLDRFEAEAGLYPVETEVRGAGAVGFGELKSMVFGEQQLAPLPLYGSAQGGDLGEENDFQLTELDLNQVLDYLRRPAGLADDSDSYALTIVGASMSPRFKPGERVGVSPRAKVEIGDDVIVQLRGENTNRVHRVLIKELVRRNATYIVLRQHNPSRELRVERSDVLAMHKVKGHFL
jgi:phage repressor protein C with HTH and peptisase S24 domain